MMIHLLVTGLIFHLAPPLVSTANAQSVTLESLQGHTINTRVRFSGTFRNQKGTAPGTILVTMQLRIGPGDALNVNYARRATAHTPVGDKTGTISRDTSGRIGSPSKNAEGNSLWLLEGDQLVNLNVREVGGYKTVITFAGTGDKLSCKVTTSYAPEVGAGPGKTTSAATGGKVEVLAQKATSSSCSVSRP
jgi:hypothetical protein